MRKIYYWCDACWVDSLDALDIMLYHRSDDYAIIEVPDEMDDEEIDQLVHEKIS